MLPPSPGGGPGQGKGQIRAVSGREKRCRAGNVCGYGEHDPDEEVWHRVVGQKDAPAPPRNHAMVEARTDGEATRQFGLPSSLASASPADGAASGASMTDALIV